ncbi:hypothetical protein AX15_006176 [Amanita polypyramis BW_CC]|nr:hypothetical protein AX15_006176 [Amanita polypyramis BW_CC]
MPHQGRCLCGGSTITVDADPTSTMMCHCGDCIRCNGTAFSTQVIVPRESVKIEGTYKTFDVQVPSGNTPTRWFCTGCGSQLMFYSKSLGEKICVHVGNIEAFTKLPVGKEIFAKTRWPSLKPVEGAQQFIDHPVFGH